MMTGEKKQRRIDRIDGRTVLLLTLCACIVTLITTSFWGHGIFTFWIFLCDNYITSSLDFSDPVLVRPV